MTLSAISTCYNGTWAWFQRKRYAASCWNCQWCKEKQEAPWVSSWNRNVTPFWLSEFWVKLPLVTEAHQQSWLTAYPCDSITAFSLWNYLKVWIIEGRKKTVLNDAQITTYSSCEYTLEFWQKSNDFFKVFTP